MISVELVCYFRPRVLSFEDGVGLLFELMKDLQTIDPFRGGWEVEGTTLADDPEGVLAKLRDLQGPSGADEGFFFAGAESARQVQGLSVAPEQYLTHMQFNNVDGGLELRFSVIPDLAKLETMRAVMERLLNWWPVQHIHVSDMHFARLDSPLDPVNRVGIGWAAWVPFSVTPEQVPQAHIAQAIGAGTFLASQQTYWDTLDRTAVKRAQDLELQLNALGLLPTRTVLQQGTWGQTP